MHSNTVQACTVFECILISRWWPSGGQHGLIQKVIAGEQAVRNELHVAAGRNVIDPADRFELLRNSLHALRDVGTIIVLALAQNDAGECKTPGLLRCMWKTQALEGDRKPHDVAVRRQPAFIIPESVKTVIVGLPFGIYGVLLNTERIRIEDISAVVVAKGIEQNADAVVLVHVLTLGQMRANLAIVVAHENHVEILIVI